MPASQSYAAAEIRRLTDRGPRPEEGFYRLQMSGHGQTNHVNVTPEQAERIAEILDDPDSMPRFAA